MDAFVNAVLEGWVSSMDGPAVPCNWLNLLDCMEKAGMSGYSIQEIRDAVIPSAGEIT